MTNDIPATHTADEIRQWIVDRLVERLQIDRQEIDVAAPVTALGVDSMQFVVLVGELEDWLGCRFASNPLIEYPTIDALSQFIAAELKDGHDVINP